MGGVEPSSLMSVKIEHSIPINAPLERVFAVYEDVEDWNRWDPDMRPSDDAQFLALVRQNYANDQILRRLPELALPDCLLVAGSVFQTVWNTQSGKAPTANILDYDIFYFDNSDLTWEAEDDAIRRVNRAFSDLGVTVQVRNQARVHLWYETKFGIPCSPLVSSEDGIDHFLNQSSCFGIRAINDRIAVYAPFGFDDLYAMIVRPNRRRDLPMVYAEKVARWKAAWPALTVVPWKPETCARQYEPLNVTDAAQ
jgi:uncharacterized protein